MDFFSIIFDFRNYFGRKYYLLISFQKKKKRIAKVCFFFFFMSLLHFVFSIIFSKSIEWLNFYPAKNFHFIIATFFSFFFLSFLNVIDIFFIYKKKMQRWRHCHENFLFNKIFLFYNFFFKTFFRLISNNYWLIVFMYSDSNFHKKRSKEIFLYKKNVIVMFFI